MTGAALAQVKAAARKAAFARRKAAQAAGGDVAARRHLSDWLAPHRGRVLAGYMPIRTEIDPRPVMAEMARHGPVGVPVIEGPGQPLKFRAWTPAAGWAMAAAFTTARWSACARPARRWRWALPMRRRRPTACRLSPPTSRSTPS